MATIVVLGMHGAGTSLVAGMLDAAGVAMNPNPRGYMRRKKYRTYEDSEFVRLNASILHEAGGNWKRMPDFDRLETMPDHLMGRMQNLIDDRDEKYQLWGFKDPRTALTVHLYHPRLSEPRYVVVGREPEDIANSLATRGAGMGTPEKWLSLVDTYYERIEQFLVDYIPIALHVRYDALLDGDEEVRRLLEFVGIERDNAVEQAAGMIKADDENHTSDE